MKLAESDFAMGIKFFAKKINVTDYTFTLSNFKTPFIQTSTSIRYIRAKLRLQNRPHCLTYTRKTPPPRQNDTRDPPRCLPEVFPPPS